MNNRKIIFTLVLGFLSVAFFSCKKDEPTIDPGLASARLVNTVRGSSSQDLHQQNTKLTKSAVSYGSFSDYVNLVGGASVIWINDPLLNKANAAADAILYDKSKYTLFYYENANAKGAIAGYVNEDKTPAAGKFRIRFLNICTVFEGKLLEILDKTGVVINSGLGFGVNPIYTELLPSTEILINVKDEGVFTSIPASTFQSGKTYLVWFDTPDRVTVQYHIVPQE